MTTTTRAALFLHLLFASLAVACTGAPCPRSSDASPWVSVRYRTTGAVGLGQELLSLVGRLEDAAVPVEDATICPDAKNTLEMVNCLDAILSGEEKQLNALNAEIMEKITVNDRPFFEKADRAWRAYQEANCESVAVLYGRGSIRPVMKLHCKIDMANERMTELRNIQKYHLSEPP
jgi:uncharacterized protein YecT (DUF1311 family)